MSKQRLILLLSISLILADNSNTNSCYGGCDTCDGVVCLSCAQANAVVDPNGRACICANNYYASSLSPLTCEALISGNPEDNCDIQIGLNVALFNVNPLCYYYTENAGVDGAEQNFFRSDVSIDVSYAPNFDSVNCYSYITTDIQYQPSNYNFPTIDQNYIDLPVPASNIPYVSALPGGNPGDQRIQIPLIDVYNLAYSQSISSDGNQIIQIINFRILISSTSNITYRSHRWVSYIYTNRNEVQTFTIEVDIQQTQGCAPGQNCIVIADLDVTGDQYASDWVTVNTSHEYTVGDDMYMRIWFIDSTYTKQLSFQTLYYLNDQNQVYDYTSIVVPSGTGWNHGDNSLHVELPLVNPSSSATIQVNMLIEALDARMRRFLQSTSSSSSSSSTSNASTGAQQQFTVTVTSPLPSTTTATTTAAAASTANNASSSKTSSLMVLFAFIQFIGLMLLY